jgi:transglutaminase-like putative cysteine protease
MSKAAARLTPLQFSMTAASVLAAVLPHLLRLPTLFALLILGLLVGRFFQRSLGGARIPTLLRLPLVLLVPVLVVVHYGNVFGREPGSALACTMLALKLLETETTRDAHAAVAFSCFVLMSALLFNSGMAFTLVLCAALALFLSTLLQLELRPLASTRPVDLRRRITGSLRVSALGLVAAIPLTLCAFIFLPRLGSPLWGAPTDTAVARTGLGDSMDPSGLQELLIDDSPAFRVSFDGALPARSKLYWRGPVLTHFDGQVWKRAGHVGEGQQRDAVAQTADVVNYEVTLEPSDRRWLLALDVPLAAPENATRASDMSLVAAKPVDELLRYRASSALHYQLNTQLSDRERERDLATPAGFNPRAQALATQWRNDSGGDDTAIIRAALDLFHRDFFYSLTVPESGRNAIDDFLFETHKGFCQHYSSAFTFLMRSAGIPARVVTGYQGGYFNKLGNYLVVRQSDAHAWSEVWLQGRGWVRVDPTAAVSPERIELGARAGAGSSVAWYRPDWLAALRNQFDIVNRGWNSLIVQFNMLRQQSLLTPFGIDKAEYYDLIWVLIGSSTLLLGLYSWWVLRRPRARGDALDVAYSALCGKLAKIGVPRAANEGPVSFATRLNGAATDPGLQVIFDRYVSLRYAHALPASDAVREFTASVRALRVPEALAKIYRKGVQRAG